MQMFYPVCEALFSSAWSTSIKETLRSTQTKTLFLATQALLRDLHSKASFSVSKALFLAIQALCQLIYDMQLFICFYGSKATQCICFLLGVKRCLLRFAIKEHDGHKNNLPF